MISPQKQGRILEELFSQSWKYFGKGDIYTGDAFINSTFAPSERSLDGIDHVIIIDKYLITIQDKWTSKAPSVTVIDHFTTPTMRLLQLLHQNGCPDIELLMGLIVSKKPPTKRAAIKIQIANTNFVHPDVFIAVYDDTSLKMLLCYAMNIICTRLYDFGIKSTTITNSADIGKLINSLNIDESMFVSTNNDVEDNSLLAKLIYEREEELKKHEELKKYDEKLKKYKAFLQSMSRFN